MRNHQGIWSSARHNLKWNENESYVAAKGYTENEKFKIEFEVCLTRHLEAADSPMTTGKSSRKPVSLTSKFQLDFLIRVSISKMEQLDSGRRDICISELVFVFGFFFLVFIYLLLRGFVDFTSVTRIMATRNQFITQFSYFFALALVDIFF